MKPKNHCNGMHIGLKRQPNTVTKLRQDPSTGIYYPDN